jgi:hypothetical protein
MADAPESGDTHVGAKRPRSVTAIAFLFAAAGIVGVAYHATELDIRRPFEDDAGWVLLVRLLAIVAGVFMFRGANWARWLALAWLAFHVVLSAWHSVSETIAHAVLLAVIAYVLFRPNAAAYFRDGA